MKRYTDNQNRTWNIEINIATVKRVRDLVKVDLLALDTGLMDRIYNDPIELCNVLYAICEPQAKNEGVSDEEFGRGLAGDAIDLAATAFVEELVDFFPQGKRPALKAALARANSVIEKQTQKMVAKLEDPQFEAALMRKLDAEREAYLQSAMSLPESSASTQTP